LDFLIYEILYHNQVFRPKILEGLPNLVRLMERFELLPAIAEFMTSSAFIKAPCFRPWAKVPI
jgi:hypothetical protein